MIIVGILASMPESPADIVKIDVSIADPVADADPHSVDWHAELCAIDADGNLVWKEVVLLSAATAFEVKDAVAEAITELVGPGFIIDESTLPNYDEYDESSASVIVNWRR